MITRVPGIETPEYTDDILTEPILKVESGRMTRTKAPVQDDSTLQPDDENKDTETKGVTWIDEVQNEARNDGNDEGNEEDEENEDKEVDPPDTTKTTR